MFRQKWKIMLATLLCLVAIGCAGTSFISDDMTPSQKAKRVMDAFQLAVYNLGATARFIDPNLVTAEEQIAFDAGFSKINDGVSEVTEVIDGIVRRHEGDEEELLELRKEVERLETARSDLMRRVAAVP